MCNCYLLLLIFLLLVVFSYLHDFIFCLFLCFSIIGRLFFFRYCPCCFGVVVVVVVVAVVVLVIGC